MTPIYLVKRDDFTALDPGAQLTRPFVVVLTGRIDDHKIGQQILQVEPHMRLGRRLAPPVLGPVHAVGHQFYDRGVHHVNRHLETKGRIPGPARHKSRRLLPQVVHHPPEQLLGHLRRALPVGIGKPVMAGGGRAVHARQRSGVQLQPIAQVIQTDAMGQLCVNQTDPVTPRLEGSRLILGSGLPRYFFASATSHLLQFFGIPSTMHRDL